MPHVSLETVSSKMKRWGETFTKPPLLTLSRAERAQGPPCVSVYSETAVPSNGTTRSMHTTPPSRALPLLSSPLFSSELLQDKEALIK